MRDRRHTRPDSMSEVVPKKKYKNERKLFPLLGNGKSKLVIGDRRLKRERKKQKTKQVNTTRPGRD